MEIVRTEFLTKFYGEGDAQVKALHSTDLTIEKGDFTVILGPSGSGKSTLLHLLAGLDKPTAGHVYINNKDIYKMKEKELSRFRRRNIGFIFQFFNLIPMLSIEENIKLPLIMDGQEVDKKYVEDLLEVLDIKNRRQHLPGQVSGGQQQRTAIARALINKPSIIFADEPTGNLDSKNSKEVLELLKRSIKLFNQTMVMITHNAEVASYADRIITIEDGHIVKDKRVMK